MTSRRDRISINVAFIFNHQNSIKYTEVYTPTKRGHFFTANERDFNIAKFYLLNLSTDDGLDIKMQMEFERFFKECKIEN